MTEKGFLPTYSQTCAHPPQPSSQLIVLDTAGLFVLLISLSQRLVERPFPPTLHPSTSFSNRWAKPPISLLQGGLGDYTHSSSIFTFPKIQKRHSSYLRTEACFSCHVLRTAFSMLVIGLLPRFSSKDSMAYIRHEIKDLFMKTWQGNTCLLFFVFSLTQQRKTSPNRRNNFIYSLKTRRSLYIPQRCL